jgi:hypothetical protein
LKIDLVMWTLTGDYYYYVSIMPQAYSRLKSFRLHENENLRSLFLRFVRSPISSFKMALRMHDSRVIASIQLSDYFDFLDIYVVQVGKILANKRKTNNSGY